jgi:hypothetical protein
VPGLGPLEQAHVSVIDDDAPAAWPVAARDRLMVSRLPVDPQLAERPVGVTEEEAADDRLADPVRGAPHVQPPPAPGSAPRRRGSTGADAARSTPSSPVRRQALGARADTRSRPALASPSGSERPDDRDEEDGDRQRQADGLRDARGGGDERREAVLRRIWERVRKIPTATVQTKIIMCKI